MIEFGPLGSVRYVAEAAEAPDTVRLAAAVVFLKKMRRFSAELGGSLWRGRRPYRTIAANVEALELALVEVDLELTAATDSHA